MGLEDAKPLQNGGEGSEAQEDKEERGAAGGFPGL